MKNILNLEPGPTGNASFHNRIIRTMLGGEGEHSPELREDDELQGSYDPRAVKVAVATWRKRMVHEYESASVFAQIVPQLMEAGATIDFKTTVLRCAMDELRHATLCAQVITFLGDDPRTEVEIELGEVPKHTDCSKRICAVRNLLFASLTETISMGLLTEERERVQEPYIGRVLRRLASDESLHARVGWTYLAAVHEDLSEEERQSLRDYLPVALGHMEAELLHAMPIGTGIDPPKKIMDDLFSLGFSEGKRARSLMYQAIDEVVLSRLDAFGLNAHEAWENRITH